MVLDQAVSVVLNQVDIPICVMLLPIVSEPYSRGEHAE